MVVSGWSPLLHCICKRKRAARLACHLAERKRRSTAMLELSHIQKSFDGVSVLKDISIQVEDGEIVSILGPSGCGKTTLLNIILGIVEADAGTIVYNGEDLEY